MLNGALLAVEEINASAAFPFTLDCVIVDPAGLNARYADLAKSMLTDGGLTHVVGCYTSSSRKEVQPYFEKYDGMLWYPSHYEGFESCENTVYTGASPNQHIIPLANFLLKHHGAVAYFIGSNYIWAWENNRIMREAVLAAGGVVLAERYAPVGETDHSSAIAQILALRPNFIFNTLIGDSAYAFFRALRAAATRAGIDQSTEIPVASCSLSEPELKEIGPEACDGHISSSVYFQSIATSANAAFIGAYLRRFPDQSVTSADAEASYVAVHLLARVLRSAGSQEITAVRSALGHVALDAPQGRVHIDSDNRHCFLTPRIGVSTRSSGFNIIFQSAQPVKPDPYLVWDEARVDRRLATPGIGSRLKVVK